MDSDRGHDDDLNITDFIPLEEIHEDLQEQLAEALDNVNRLTRQVHGAREQTLVALKERDDANGLLEEAYVQLKAQEASDLVIAQTTAKVMGELCEERDAALAELRERCEATDHLVELGAGFLERAGAVMDGIPDECHTCEVCDPDDCPLDDGKENR